MKKFRASSSRKWSDDDSEDGSKQPPPAVLRHPSDSDRSEALSPGELEHMHTEMILALTNDGANSVYSGSAAAPPPADGLLRDQHTPHGGGVMRTGGDSYDEKLAQKLQQDEYPGAPSNNTNTSSDEDRMSKEHRDDYGDDGSGSLNPMEYSAEILELTGGGIYSPVARKKAMESNSSNSLGSSTRAGSGEARGGYKLSAKAGAARASAGGESSHPQPPATLISSTMSSAAASSRSGRLLRPSQSLSFSKSTLSSVDRRERGISSPGAYVVDGMNASGSDDGGGHSVIHEGDVGEEDMSMAVQERASDPLSTPSSTYAVGEAWTPLYRNEETPLHGRALEAQVEQAGILTQYSSRKFLARRRRFVIIGVILVVAVVVAVVVATGGSGKKDTSTEAITPLPDDTDTPSTAPTAFVCSVQDIYLECQGGASSFQSNSIPGCVSQLYQTYQESFLSQIDPMIQDLEPTSCAPQNLALYALASTEETESIRIKYILNVVYFSTNGHLWKDSSNWLSATPECSWLGVSCADDGIVRELDLVDNDLSGTIPPAIGLLDTLLKLHLGRNNLMSPIPTELSNLQDLDVLDLSRAALDPGPIPAPILILSRLQFLDLSSTGRTGTIPEELNTLTLLSSLVLENNSFNGTLPSDLFFLPFLTVLTLGINDLTGAIPNEIGNAALMIRMNLERNQLVGTMPTSIGLLTSLALFTFSYNDFSGSIPLEVCGLWNHSLTTFGGPIAECQGRATFYGNLECPSRECCQNCESVFQE
jgi:hypothetical protein